MNEDGVKISQLPVADALANGDVVAGVSEGVTKAFPVDLLKGQKGDPGAPGAPGPQGEPGEPGAPGKDGSDASVDIQQTTGTSTTAVMSQDATTKAINAETSARETAVQGLQSSVEANASAISAETTAREGAISAEATARQGADSTLQTAVDNLATQVATDLQNYYTKTQTDQMVSAIPKFAISVVDTLPTENISDTTVYLVSSGEDSPNLYVEWIHVADKWEQLGTQTVDLTDYYTKTEADAKFALATALNNYYTKTEADGRYVAQTRTVNGKALSSNITLAASDVGAVPTSSFTITSTGQTRANNLPTAVVRAMTASSSSTATQAKVTANTMALATGAEVSDEINLPMATTSKAGCITAKEKSKISTPFLGVANQQTKYTEGMVLSTTETKWLDLPSQTVGTTSSGSILLGGFTIKTTAALTSSSSIYFVIYWGGVSQASASVAIGPEIKVGQTKLSIFAPLSFSPPANTPLELWVRKGDQITQAIELGSLSAKSITLLGYMS